VIASFPGPHANYFQDRFAAKEVTLELVPQGSCCERMRPPPLACKVSTPPWASVPSRRGKEERVLQGQRCILELPIQADYAFIKRASR